MRRIIAVSGIVVALAFTCIPSVVRGQERLTQQCATVSTEQTRRFCNLVVEAIEIAQPRIGLALTGGNPVPGANSTLGMRVGSVPRVSIGGRITAVSVDLPPIQRPGSTEEIDAFVPSLNIDASLGLLSGWSPLPTVGGLGSLDLVASLGFIPLPGDEGFGDSPTSWAVGARVGILRESFTAPGVSITAMYRRLSDVSYGDATLQTEQSFFRASNPSVISLRGVVGKRLLTLGASAGLGWDRYNSDVTFAVGSAGSRFDFTEDGFKSSRVTAFGGLQFTLVILSLAGEIGWQSGGDDFTAPLPAGQTSTAQNSSWYGSLALRLAI